MELLITTFFEKQERYMQERRWALYNNPWFYFLSCLSYRIKKNNLTFSKFKNGKWKITEYNYLLSLVPSPTRSLQNILVFSKYLIGFIYILCGVYALFLHVTVRFCAKLSILSSLCLLFSLSLMFFALSLPLSRLFC